MIWTKWNETVSFAWASQVHLSIVHQSCSSLPTSCLYYNDWTTSQTCTHLATTTLDLCPKTRAWTHDLWIKPVSGVDSEGVGGSTHWANETSLWVCVYPVQWYTYWANETSLWVCVYPVQWYTYWANKTSLWVCVYPVQWYTNWANETSLWVWVYPVQ